MVFICFHWPLNIPKNIQVILKSLLHFIRIWRKNQKESQWNHFLFVVMCMVWCRYNQRTSSFISVIILLKFCILFVTFCILYPDISYNMYSIYTTLLILPFHFPALDASSVNYFNLGENFHRFPLSFENSPLQSHTGHIYTVQKGTVKKLRNWISLHHKVHVSRDIFQINPVVSRWCVACRIN